MEKKGKIIEILKLILMFILVMAIEIGIGYVFSYLEYYKGMNLPTFLHVVVLDVCLLIPVFIYTIVKKESIVEAFTFKPVKVTTLLLTALLTLVSSPMYMFANVLSQFFVPNVMVQEVGQMASESIGLTLVAAAICAPIAEEILCRGFFANRLKREMPFVAAAIVSGLMFGILHLNFNQFCYAFVLGVIFAYTNRASGSIFTSMLMHFLINASNLALLFAMNYVLSAAGMDLGELAEESRGNASSLAETAIFIGVLAVGSFFLSRMLIREIAKNEG